MLQDPGNQVRIQETAALVPADAQSLADIGCGNGVFGKYLLALRPGIRLMSVDRSEKALSYVDTDKALGDVTGIPLPDRSYDCVSCLQVLEHVPVANYGKALSELARVSSKYIIISVPYRERLEDNTTKCPQCATIFNIDLHLRTYDDDAVSKLLEKQNFVCVSTKNVVQSTQLRGLKYIQRVKQVIRKNQAIFNSPICPVCGYENQAFHLATASENKAATVSLAKGNAAKEMIKRIWPKKKVDGYWMIALYKKR